ncbi:hypothetical protein [Actinophytocola sp. NPDC049390]|uniref:hypothetical protein n=1 Tax=Actinophytocola sp. NPDC049390 TaxID=3363894 RepID=UPI003791946B
MTDDHIDDHIDDPDLVGLRGRTRYGPRWRPVGQRMNDAARAFYAGDIAGAEAILDEVLQATDDNDDNDGGDGEALDLRARALANRAQMAGARGDLTAALRYDEECLVLCAEVARGDDRFGVSDIRSSVLINQAQTLQSLGRSEEALRVLDEVAAAGAAADANASLLSFLLHHTRAAALVVLARYAEAETEARLALDVAMASEPRLAAEAYATLGTIAARTGDDGSATEHLAVARDLHGLTGTAFDRADDERQLGRLAAGAGRLDEAEERLARAQAEYERAGRAVEVAECRMSRSVVAMRQLRFPDAVDHVTAALDTLRETGAVQSLIECHLVHAQLTFVMTGNMADTEEAFLRGRELAVAGRVWHEVARIDYNRAQLSVDAAELTETGTRADMHQRVLQLAVMAALAADGFRHRYSPGPIRERWARFVAVPARSLALRVAAALGLGELVFLLVEYFSAGTSLQAGTPDELDLQRYPAPDLDSRLAPPPRLLLLPGDETVLDVLVAQVEQEYHLVLRSAEVVRAW